MIAKVSLPMDDSTRNAIASCWTGRERHAKLENVSADPQLRDRIVRESFLNNPWLFESALKLTEFMVLEHFPLVILQTDDIGFERLRRIAGVELVYEPAFHDGLGYMNTILALHASLLIMIDQRSRGLWPTHCVNLSLGPTMHAGRFDPDEPMNIATKICARAGIVLCFAAGNRGPAENTLNPWCVAPWVIGVGAADDTGKKLWTHSSRGVRVDPSYRPTVVAPGIDIPADESDLHGATVYRIVKSGGEISRSKTPTDAVEGTSVEEAYIDGVLFQKITAGGGIARPKFVSGTSFATAVVTGVVHQTYMWMLDVLIGGGNVSRWNSVLKENKSPTKLRPIEPSVVVIKRLFKLMAVEMPGYGAHEVGFGFISPEIARQHLEQFTLAHYLALFDGSNDDATWAN
ncbi:MAG TPA: S8 family serine peptidase [Ilumatobacter sp.]|nr:S8 family serine peptidase [Ilumatobacter sp.]